MRDPPPGPGTKTKWLAAIGLVLALAGLVVAWGRLRPRPPVGPQLVVTEPGWRVVRVSDADDVQKLSGSAVVSYPPASGADNAPAGAAGPGWSVEQAVPLLDGHLLLARQAGTQRLDAFVTDRRWRLRGRLKGFPSAPEARALIAEGSTPNRLAACILVQDRTGRDRCDLGAVEARPTAWRPLLRLDGITLSGVLWADGRLLIARRDDTGNAIDHVDWRSGALTRLATQSDGPHGLPDFEQVVASPDGAMVAADWMPGSLASCSGVWLLTLPDGKWRLLTTEADLLDVTRRSGQQHFPLTPEASGNRYGHYLQGWVDARTLEVLAHRGGRWALYRLQRQPTGER